MAKYKTQERTVDAVQVPDGTWQINGADGVIVYLGKDAFEFFMAEVPVPKPAFPDGLVYSATTCCPNCGRGLAYRQFANPRATAWECAGLLTGAVPRDEEDQHAVYPFVFWEVKSELQPSVAGQTTRPRPEGAAP